MYIVSILVSLGLLWVKAQLNLASKREAERDQLASKRDADRDIKLSKLNDEVNTLKIIAVEEARVREIAQEVMIPFKETQDEMKNNVKELLKIVQELNITIIKQSK